MLYESIKNFVYWSDSKLRPVIEYMFERAKELGYFELLDRDVALYCEVADDETDGVYPYHYFEHTFQGNSCKYCGLAYSDYQVLLDNAEDEYIADLGYSTITDHGFFDYYPSGWYLVDHSGGKLLNGSAVTSFNGGFSVDGLCLSAIPSSSGFGYVRSADFTLPAGLFSLSFDFASGFAGSYGSSSGNLWTLRLCGMKYGVMHKIHDFYVSTSGSFPATFVFSTLDYDYDSFFIYCSSYYYNGLKAGAAITGSRSCHIECLELADGPVSSDPASRTSSLMSLLDEYNSLNSYLENEDAVNFFLGSVDSDGNITGVYGPSVYDEETLIFTEPVTGAQYQTTGWSYDYYTRSYTISLEPGTMTVGQREASRIILRYDDDKVRIIYEAENGLTLASEEYSYVMASQSSCALNGHSYSVETLTEATCTSQGERLYTCSVCGDQKVEDVPMKDHRVSHSVFKDATCTDPGYAFYTCMDCGTQYSDELPALGHDWIPEESVENSFALPEDAACPECSSVDFSSALDQEASTYTCTCNACGAQWLESAQVTHGYTAYSCSRCGARKTERLDVEDNGLFRSIGNFIADGIRWCTDKLSQFVDGLTGMLDTFNDYLEQIGVSNSSYPDFLAKFIAIFPEDMMAVIWFLIVAAVVVAVIKFWFR